MAAPLSSSALSRATLALIVLFLAVLPAKVNMAVRDFQPAGFHIPVVLSWARAPFQLVLIFWAWRVSRPAPSSAEI